MGITKIGGSNMKNALLLLILLANESFAMNDKPSAMPVPTAVPTIVPPPTPTPTPTGGGNGTSGVFTEALQNQSWGVAETSAAGAVGLSTVSANPSLWPCISANAIAAGATRPASDYDCTPTPRDSTGKLTGSLTNYRNWSSVLYKQNSTTPVNGYYSKNGTRCSTSVATDACPIAVKVQFVYNCDTTELMMNGKCVKAKSIEVYHAIYQERNIAGEAPLKPLIIGDTNVDAGAISATPVSSSALTGMVYNDFKCSSLTPTGVPAYIQLGTDKYGAPICGQDPNQSTIDNLQVKMCEIETKQVQENGGITTTCSPNITVIKLYGGNHLASECTALNGQTVDLNGTIVSATNAAQNKKLFCKLPGSCSSRPGWVNYATWNTTTSASCRSNDAHNSYEACCGSGQNSNLAAGYAVSTNSQPWGNHTRHAVNYYRVTTWCSNQTGGSCGRNTLSGWESIACQAWATTDNNGNPIADGTCYSTITTEGCY